ncbi:STAM-binding protein [Leptopilina heterotoma]|uniref:STAM-binding protein n=1 Tax=Leptopilina heterotoma TaxID=63436 RepID=UPI001CA844EE|nr:STAM-binding protein [Leptopilina heterotoma]
MDPVQRLKIISDNCKAVSVDPNILPIRYCRSGVEMIRQADIYLSEGNSEHAYTLYMKFLTIFLEKIREHPKYNTIIAKDKLWIQQALREVLPKTEELKKKLLEQYGKDFAEMEEKKRIENERLKREELQRLREVENRKSLAALSKPKIGISAGAMITSDTKTIKPLYPPFSTPISPRLDNKVTSSEDKKIPSVDRSTKPIIHDDKLGLRDMVLPKELMNSFLRLAAPNTMSQKETCGVLAGKLERNKLIVTHLLIPHQTGSPDSCLTHNEEDIFDYQDQYNLITLGWVHTHPTQTAFLSSVDLHTHCAYQLLMAEAIAIVCAPKYEETGFFILTPEYGLDFIANCRENGFHPHPTDIPLYTKAKHCKLDPMANVEVVDLRRK